MAKCLKCGESINTLYDEDELCDSCDSEVLNGTTEKVLENQNIEKEYSKKNNYTFWNMLIIPLLFSYVSGLCLGEDLNSSIPLTIATGSATLLLTYHPLKIFILFINRYFKSKWEWPYSLSFFILPILFLLFQIYMNYNRM